jgi:hypothetical protein
VKALHTACHGPLAVAVVEAPRMAANPPQYSVIAEFKGPKHLLQSNDLEIAKMYADGVVEGFKIATE